MTDTTPALSLFSRLEPLLASVGKPIQYVGGEHNSVVKDWDAVDVRWCLSYPDAYEVGQPNQGLAILYEILNERDWMVAERTFSVWPDLAAKMREHGLPQFTLENHLPVKAFDMLGVSFSTELGYTNLLEALDLAGIPLHSVDRGEDDPIVIAGGHAAFNPEPIADFIDAAVLGDGEEAALIVSELVRSWKAAGSLAASANNWRATRSMRAASCGASSTSAPGCLAALPLPPPPPFLLPPPAAAAAASSTTRRTVPVTSCAGRSSAALRTGASTTEGRSDTTARPSSRR